MRQRILVCGGRDYLDEDTLSAVLDKAHEANPIDLLIHGACAGADMLAEMWAGRAGVETAPFPADWDAHGKAAGPIRNRQMLDEGKPDLVIAFPGGRGTADMVRTARNAGVPVVAVRARAMKPRVEAKGSTLAKTSRKLS